MTNDIRRLTDLRQLIELRAEVRASYYRCRRAIALVPAARLRAVLERGAFARWRLVRSLDAYIAAQPGGRSLLRPTLHDLAARLALRTRVAMAENPGLHCLRWLADDSARLRHSVEICRALTVSLVVSDLLGDRLAELKQVQVSTANLMSALPSSTPADGPHTLATT